MFRSSIRRLSTMVARPASSRRRAVLLAGAFAFTSGSLVFASGLRAAEPVPISLSMVEPITSYKTEFLVECPCPLPSFERALSMPLSQLLRYFQYPANAAPDVPLTFTNNSDNQTHKELELTVRRAQDRICQNIADLEVAAAKAANRPPVAIREDLTIRADGGGYTRVIQDGLVFSKAGCNTSVSNVSIPLGRMRDMAEDHEEIRSFFAENDKTHALSEGALVKRFTASISLVLHAVSPHVPTVHANYRYFEISLPNGRQFSWFAGGSDLTPAVVNVEDGKFFHTQLKETCDQFDPAFYPQFKKNCDQYFTLAHRKESRGIGGIFFDDLRDPARRSFYHEFIKALSSGFSASYFPLVLKHHGEPYTNSEVEWKQFRGGRYVEFNLLYDKGTSFGFRQPNARPDSILMSLPLNARFEYKKAIEKGTPEELTMNILKNPIEWV